MEKDVIYESIYNRICIQCPFEKYCHESQTLCEDFLAEYNEQYGENK